MTKMYYATKEQQQDNLKLSSLQGVPLKRFSFKKTPPKRGVHHRGVHPREVSMLERCPS